MENRRNHQMKNIGFVLLATVFGFALGYMMLAFIPDDIRSGSFYAIPLLLISLYVCYLLQIFVHELGHLIFGFLTGYSFVSFRVGPFMLSRRNGKLKFSTLNIPGTGGQCLMDPPAYEEGNYPFLLYNLGGVLLNLGVAIGSFLLMNEAYSFFINVFLVSFALTGILAAVTNAYPVKVSGIPTDGHNILSIYKEDTIKRAFWLQLESNALLSNGAKPRELPVGDFQVETSSQLTNPLITSIQLFKYSHYLDLGNLEKAEDALETLVPYLQELIPIYRNETKLQLIYLELIGENNHDQINQLFDDSLAQHLRITPNWLNHQRVFMAYEWFHNRNKEKAMKHYLRLQELAPEHPNTGEAKMELRLAEYLKEQMLLPPNEMPTSS